MSLRIAFDTLRSHPLRTALSTLGVLIGAAALVAVLSLGDGFENAVREMANADGRMQTIALGARTFDQVAGQRVQRRAPPKFTSADVDSLSGWLAAQTRGGVSVRLWQSGLGLLREEPWSRRAGVRGIMLVGAHVSPGAVPMPIAAGRALGKSDDQSHVARCVISDSLARLIANDAKGAVGHVIRLESESLVVVGVLERSATDARSPVLATVPLTLAPTVFSDIAARSEPAFQLRVARVEEVGNVKQAASMWLRRRFGAQWTDSASVQSYEQEAAQGAKGLLMFKLFMGAITGISLVVGGIGIMNVLLAGVTERTREIGIRRAVGARRQDILRQFLLEAVVISLFGSLCGVILGMGAARVAAAVMRTASMGNVEAGFSLSTFAVACVSAIATGLVFGSYPALRASRLTPLEALRHE
jgi:putative ABC transport system permease protein